MPENTDASLSQTRHTLNQVDIHKSEEMSTRNFEGYVLQGGQLIAQQNFQGAIDHFANRDIAHQAGLALEMDRQILYDTGSTTDDEIDAYANWVAMNCWCNEDNKLVLAGIRINNGSNETPPPPSLSHNIALVYMEEWLHALQNKKGAPLASQQDEEVDIAAYMLQNGIPVTPAFMARYDRALVLYGQESTDDSLSQVPTMNVGRYCRVERSSDGNTETNWQVYRFNHNKGTIIVTNGSEMKLVSKEEFAKLNQTGVYPYSEASSFQDLFQILDKYPTIVGTQTVYKNSDIKKIINQIRQGQVPIEALPKSGGLRLKVHELIKS